MAEVIVVSDDEIAARLAELEARLPALSVVWNDPEWNHGDSCWMGHPDIAWSSLADDYDALKFLAGHGRPAPASPDVSKEAQ